MSSSPIVEFAPGDEVTAGRPGDAGTMLEGPVFDEDDPGGPSSGAPTIEGYAPDGIAGEGYDGSGYYDDPVSGCGGCGHCDQCRSHSRLFPLLRDCWSHPGTSGSWGRNLSGIGAVQAFKSPVDLGVNGNFGVYYGGNWGFPVLNRAAIGGQIGAIGSWADFQGSNGLVNSSRNQWFVTTGLFRRAMCNEGLQGGAVLDYLSDNFYVNMNLFQVRAEIGYVWNRHEVGFWTAAHTNSDTQAVPVAFGVPTVTWQANNQYDLYYRYYYNYNTVGRMWVGLTSYGDVLFGGDATATLNDQWAVQVAYNYMIPSNDPTIPKAIKETWGLTIGTVWYPRCKTPNCKFDSYRPLFAVADNTRFFVKAK